MSRQLAVYLFDILVGYLDQDSSGNLSFKYVDDYIGSGKPISQSLPLVPSRIFKHREARPFFGGLLPDEKQRDKIAQNLQISKKNDFAMLKGIGGECAGAITLLISGSIPIKTYDESSYRVITEKDLYGYFTQLPNHPLLTGDGGVRLSLAGAQNKMVVYKNNDQIALTFDGAPSSHIIKPSIANCEDTVFNEGFCLMLAKQYGLNAVEVEICKAITSPYLLIKRYDRYLDDSGKLQRLHQEDFCQALGIPPEWKYQNEGGPTLKQCFDLVRSSTARPAKELLKLLDALFFTILVGNNDAHGKNYSLVYGKAGIELAPIYDVLSTVVYPDLIPHFAMKLDKKSNLNDLYFCNWKQFAVDVGMAFPKVRTRLRTMAQNLPTHANSLQLEFKTRGIDKPIIGKIVTVIQDRAHLILKHLDPPQGLP